MYKPYFFYTVALTKAAQIRGKATATKTNEAVAFKYKVALTSKPLLSKTRKGGVAFSVL